MIGRELPKIISSNRVCLKKHDVGSAGLMFDIVENNREHLGKFLPWVDNVRSINDEINFINYSNDKWNELSCFCYGIWYESIYIGNIDAHSVSWENNCCEIGYWISSRYEGMGLISESVLALEHILSQIGFTTIIIKCHRANEKSKNVAIRLGYHLDEEAKSDQVKYIKRH